MEITAGQMIPEFDTKYFTQIYDNVETFIEDYKNCGIPALLKDESVETLFYLLYAKYGNNPIANSDENQFKYKLFSIVFQYGPTWEKRLEIQATLRGMSLEEARIGARSIYNHSFNDTSTAGITADETFGYVNDQNVSNYKKAPTTAMAEIWELLRVDVSDVFLKQFQKLFLRVVRPQHNYIYTTLED